MADAGNGKPAGTSGGLHSDEINSSRASQPQYTSESLQLQEARLGIAKALVDNPDYDRACIVEHFPSVPLDHIEATLDWLEERPSLLRTVLSLDPCPVVQSRDYLTLEDLDDVLSDITWLWEPWLPRGFLTLLAGEPDVGKSMLALTIGHCIVSDRPWPDGKPSPKPGKIVWVETESSMSLNNDRAKEIGIPRDRIIIPGQDKEDAIADLYLDQDEDWEKVEVAVQTSGVELAVVDSLRGAFHGDENSSQCAVFLKKLAELARDNDLGLILVHHLRKKGMFDGDKIGKDRVRGSTAIVQIPRVVWGVDKPDPQDDQRARFYMVKNNLSRRIEPIGFTIGDHGLSFGEAPTTKARRSALEQVVEFLLKFLADGPKASRVVKKKVEELGFSESTLDRARDYLNIVAEKPGDHWTMALPGKEDAHDV